MFHISCETSPNGRFVLVFVGINDYATGKVMPVHTFIANKDGYIYYGDILR